MEQKINFIYAVTWLFLLLVTSPVWIYFLYKITKLLFLVFSILFLFLQSNFKQAEKKEVLDFGKKEKIVM